MVVFLDPAAVCFGFAIEDICFESDAAHSGIEVVCCDFDAVCIGSDAVCAISGAASFGLDAVWIDMDAS